MVKKNKFFFFIGGLLKVNFRSLFLILLLRRRKKEHKRKLTPNVFGGQAKPDVSMGAELIGRRSK